MALFRCIQEGIKQPFVIEVLDEKRIEEARAIVSGKETARVSVAGTIVKQPRAYNAPWSWHLDPASIEFFDLATEVCDALALDVEQKLDDVGGAFLPRSYWCPWKSKVAEEIAD